MRNIQDKDWLYAICRPYVETHFRWTYRRLEYVGRENIPTDGAVIFAPNHVNGMQDAIAVVSTDHKPKVFVARADMFRLRWLAPLLRRAKIMPINRIRDGVENVRRNDVVMEEAVSVLRDGVAFCIMPEATHRPKHSLLPLAKGIFRIAYMASERLKGIKPVYIVPVGLEFGSYFRFRSTLLVNIGKPIDVTSFFSDNAHLSLPRAYNLLSEQLTEAMQQLILWIPDDERYEALLEACYLRERLPLLSGTLPADTTLLQRLNNDKTVVSRLLHLLEQAPGKADILLTYLREVADLRKASKVCVASVQYPQEHLLRAILCRGTVLVLTFPFFVFAAMATLPYWCVLASVFAFLEDRAFLNSLRCGLAMLFLPLWYVFVAIVLFKCLAVVWAVVPALCLLPSRFVFYEYLRHVRRWVSDVRLQRNVVLRSKINGLQTLL
ncbi:MAG: 1-acyl-sn-glycerol-3-phosphate acyltransferase [Paludibacter sp.]|nr:1-acyl-sn-glycerol-3-phosphate acyltransferase [Bacteroidales bacterium]MCM1069921.1 1-acyl-sn-glycerol-3-phosphate acyltransferase [Prevotella sp.]MCM1354662.1 1-acyl-sn-glycerol-3-phosphate acyltransferase [Bacteroides sp.]MCM1443497.1 1-acyl-sn-glycerol-3-phosphate acyltransferase [Muribaculum sp.]MCM1482603.1 1-acyl-sn-glycerol-3-phosphate acyltransferase [Paludibacter sp.]